MRLRSVTKCLMFFLAFLLFFSSCSYAGIEPLSVERVRGALSSTKSELRLQTELPMRVIAPPKKTSAFTRRLVELLVRFLRSIYDARKGISTMALLFIALFVMLLLFAFYDNWRQRPCISSSSAKKNETEGMTVEPVAIDRVRMQEAQQKAESLAREGLYAEAMHSLLLQSIAEMRRQLNLSIADSLTSREVLAAVPFADEARSVFADIIGGVEVSLYGSHNPNFQEYEACKMNYDALFHILQMKATS